MFKVIYLKNQTNDNLKYFIRQKVDLINYSHFGAMFLLTIDNFMIKNLQYQKINILYGYEKHI